MWSPTRPRLTLAGQLLVLQLVVVALVLVFVGVVSVQQSTRTFADERGTRMRSVAENLANVAVVRDQVDQPFAGQTLAPSVDRAVNLSGAGVVTIANPEGRVVASSDPSRIGARADLGDSRVREGRGWTGSLVSDGRRVVAGHAPILDDSGELVGLAVAEQPYPSTWQRFVNAGPDLVLFLGLGALFGAAGSYALSRLVKRHTRGLEPHEIAALADHREALLHSIREGVVAIDVDGRVTMANDGARELLGLTGDVIGRAVDDLGLDPAVAHALRSPDDVQDAVVLVDDRVLVLNRRSASSRGQGIGTVTTMRDRTELTALRSRLSSTLSVTDTLRAQTHEFANQLHTISGLVELGEHDEVRALVGALTRRRADQTEFVSSRVADRAVAALLVAKSSVAAEAGVELRLDPATSVPVLPTDLAGDLTTVVGNLVDNGLDAVRGRPDGWVDVLATVVDHEVRLVVSDDGDGVPQGLHDEIFVRGVSTKPDVPGGRGLGLPLVRLLCRQHGGDVTVSDRDGGGAVFVATLRVPTGDAGIGQDGAHDA